jgi:protein O-mannosyl-transferase
VFPPVTLRRALPFVLLIAITLAAWGRVPFGTFQFDDFASIVREPATSDLARMSAWRPLLHLSYRLDFALWGMDPRGFLATNLALHLATVLGVHALLRRLRQATHDEIAPFLIAAIFALHPAHAEVVANVSGRSTGLMTALLVWALALDGRRFLRAVLFVAACLAKETAIVFPALLLLVGWLRDRELPMRALAAWSALDGAVLAGLAFVPRFRELATWSFDARGPFENLWLNTRAVPEMVSLWARPWALSIDHAPVAHGSWIGALILLALVVTAIASARLAPSLAFAILWVLVVLAPTNSFFPKADLVTEKPLYLAWLGPSAVFGIAASRWLPVAPAYWRRRVALGLLFGVFGALCVQRTAVWSDPERLWSDAVAKSPDSSRAWNNLGMARLEHDRLPAARDAFRQAIRLDPVNARAQVNLHHLEILCGHDCVD